LTGQIYDAARDAANLAITITPFMTDMFASAERIYVTSRETLRLMPRRFHDKVQIELAIGTEQSSPRPANVAAPRTTGDSGLRLLHAGRFVDYKGMHLGLPAFARLIEADPKARLTMVGEGPAKRRWQKLAAELGVAKNVDWRPWQAREDMARLYADHDVLLFPAMHDSGGMVVLEAMDHGLPVVCLKLGGPATLVNETCGYAVDPEGKSVEQVVSEMGDALIRLARQSERSPLAAAARLRCRDFSWPEKVGRIYGLAS
jgi:glycosyltransferase involved in cell wall biosynthesis